MATDTFREVADMTDDEGTRHDVVADMLRFAADLVQERDRLAAQVARVEELPEQWRAEAVEMRELAADQNRIGQTAYIHEAQDSERRADGLDAALRGPESSAPTPADDSSAPKNT